MINAEQAAAVQEAYDGNAKVNITLLENYVAAMLDAETKTLRELIAVVNNSVDISVGENGVRSNIKMGAFEMEALVMRIPAECLRLQGLINQYSTRNAFKDVVIEEKFASELERVHGEKGSAEERKKKAEAACITEKSLNQINKMMIKGLQGYIDRADKVYEGIKKVMDYRSKEGWFDRKGPN